MIVQCRAYFSLGLEELKRGIKHRLGWRLVQEGISLLARILLYTRSNPTRARADG